MIGILEGKYHYRGVDILSFDSDPYGNFTKAVLSEGEKRVVLKICDGVYTKMTYNKDQVLISSAKPLDKKGNEYNYIPLIINQETSELESIIKLNSQNLSTPKTQ